MLNYKYAIYVFIVKSCLFIILEIICSSKVWETTAMLHLIDPKITFVMLQKISILNTFCSFELSSFYSSKNPAKKL